MIGSPLSFGSSVVGAAKLRPESEIVRGLLATSFEWQVEILLSCPSFPSFSSVFVTKVNEDNEEERTVESKPLVSLRPRFSDAIAAQILSSEGRVAISTRVWRSRTSNLVDCSVVVPSSTIDKIATRVVLDLELLRKLPFGTKQLQSLANLARIPLLEFLK